MGAQSTFLTDGVNTKNFNFDDSDQFFVKPCGKSFICKLANAATKLELSSGKSSLTSTELIPPEPTMETAISNWRESMFTTTKPPEANMSQELFSLIWNLVPWTLSGRDLTDRCSVPITLFLVNLEQETTGPRVTTQKVPSLWTLFWTLSVKNQNLATACKDSNLHTHWEAVPDPVWEPFLSLKSVRNIPTES